MLSILILFNCKRKKIYFFKLGSSLTNCINLFSDFQFTPLIDRITKLNRVPCKKYINTAYETNKFKNYCVSMAYLSLKYCEKRRKNLCRQSRTFNDEPHIFFIVIGAIKMSMTFLFFVFFLHEYSLAKSPRNPWDYYPQP